MFLDINVDDVSFDDKDARWLNIESEIRRRARRRIYYFCSTIAAGIVVIAACTSNKSFTNNGLEDIEYALPDGSNVQIANNATIKYNRISWLYDRHVKLKGNASFDVAKNKGTFTVALNKGKITVLGTKFIVNQNENDLIVHCTEGKVKVDTDNGSAIIKKQEIFKADYNSKSCYVNPEYYKYNNRPMSEVLEQIASVYGFTIVNPEVCDNLTFSGLITSQSIEEALNALILSCGIEYVYKDNTVILNP